MKNTVHNITTPKAGENITESYLAALTQAANRSNTILGYNGVEGSASTRQTPYVNPLMVRVRNTTNETVDQYHVLRVTDPFYTQSGAYPQAGKAFDNYIRGSLPTGEDGEEFVIVDRDCPPSGEAPAVISGPSFCKILVETGNEDCKFAKTKENKKYLVAADSGPARIVWKETGIGEKWAFVVLDRGEQNPDIYGWLISEDCDLMANPDGEGSQAPVIGRVVGVHKKDWGSSTPEYIEVYPVGYNPDYRWFIPQGCPVRVSWNNLKRKAVIVETFIPDLFGTLYEDMTPNDTIDNKIALAAAPCDFNGFQSGGKRIDLLHNIKWWNETHVTAYLPPLWCGSASTEEGHVFPDDEKLLKDTKVQIRWFPQYNAWIIVGHDCCEHESTGGGTTT